jgi:hypothetical protein
VKIGYREVAIQILVNTIKAQGGRFLKRSKSRDGKGFREVSEKKAYKTSRQAIRCTCRKVLQVVSNTNSRRSHNNNTWKSSSSSRPHDHPPAAAPEQCRPSSNSETRRNHLRRGDGDGESESELRRRICNLEMLALRLQTKDDTLTHLYLDLQAVDHDFLFPLAKALDTNDILVSLECSCCRI